MRLSCKPITMYKTFFLLIFYSFLSINNSYASYSIEILSTDNGSGSGEVEVTADGRTGPYTVSIGSQFKTITLGNISATFIEIGMGSHTAVIENAYGCIVELPFTMSRCAVDIYFYLEGAFDKDINAMHSGLNTRGLLPGQTPVSNLATPTPSGQPYNIAPWSYNGLEGSTWSDIDYAGRFGDDEPVDWVLLTVIDTSLSNHTELYKAAGIVDITGKFHFTCPIDLKDQVGLNTEFYVRIEHRNHMGILSPQHKHFTANTETETFDFRSEDSHRDATSFGQVQLPTPLGLWGMIAGDTDQFDFPSFDINGNDKTIWVNSNGVFDNYLPADMDLNGDVNGDDKRLWFDSNGKSSRIPKN